MYLRYGSVIEDEGFIIRGGCVIRAVIWKCFVVLGFMCGRKSHCYGWSHPAGFELWPSVGIFSVYIATTFNF